MNDIPDGLLWAKTNPYKELYTHLRETAIVAKCLCLKSSVGLAIQSWLPSELEVSKDDCTRLIMYLAGMHDIGKCHPVFADNPACPSADEYLKQHPELKYPFSATGYRHEKGSERIAKRIWKKQGIFDTGGISHFSAVLALHHQGKHGNNVGQFIANDPDFPGGNTWIAWQDELELRLRNWIDPPYVVEKNIKHRDIVCMMLMGIVILSDWIASGDCFSNTSGQENDAELEKRAQEFIKDIGLCDQTDLPAQNFHALWSFMNDDTLRPLQRSLQDYLSSQTEMPLAMILEAPMGEGKTEAGIYAALNMARYWHKGGFYIGLPTAATSNQMITRVNDLLNAHHQLNARLLHGTAWMFSDADLHIEEKEDRSFAEQWLMTPKRSLLTNDAVGTVDQVMMSILRIKYGILRLLGLEGKVLVIDEVHSYDAYMSDIIYRLLDWCRSLKIPVVMLSATLPSGKKSDMLKRYTKDPIPLHKTYPLITAIYEDGHVDQVNVNGSHQKGVVSLRFSEIYYDTNAIAELALEKIQNGGCLCVLVNTIKRAQAIYRRLQEIAGEDIDLMLFHARYPAGRRKEIEQTCLSKYGPVSKERPTKAILVATQVVEQSLDVDFDCMITDIAPVDLILQRVGRLHRHDTTRRPDSMKRAELTILAPDDGKYGSAKMIYFQVLLDRTVKALHELDEIHIPEDIPSLVEEVYRGQVDQDEIDAFSEKMFDDQLKEGQAEQMELRAPNDRSFTLSASPEFYDENDEWVAAKTRLGEPSVRIAIIPEERFRDVQEEIDTHGKVLASTAKELMQFTLSVAERTLKPVYPELSEERVLHGSGRLKGLDLLCAEEKTGTYMETLSVLTDNWQLMSDPQIGFTIRKRGEGE